jgi:23S rRNA (uracil1939-C5)-methyltransferase
MKININKVAYGGYGVGKINGKTIFVNYGLPGDELEIKIYRDYKNYSFAEYIDILNPSPNRLNAPCPNSGKCGGCSYQNIAYTDELKFKELILKEHLARIGSIYPEQDINIITGDRFHYRSHSRIKYRGSEIGFFSRNSNMLIPFPAEGCLLLSDVLNKNIKEKVFKKESNEIIISVDEDSNFITDQDDSLIIEEKTGELRYKREITGFFQNNRFLRKRMIDIVCLYSELTEKDEFVDICCGCGFFTIPLSKMSLRGTGYDIDKKSIEFAKSNALLNNCRNIRFYELAESAINPVRLHPKTIVIDPPRSGISKKGRWTINAINPVIIVYVSCNPSTFSRDAADFVKNNYSLKKITLIDMFPCTHHIEVVGKFVKNYTRNIIT